MKNIIVLLFLAIFTISPIVQNISSDVQSHIDSLKQELGKVTDQEEQIQILNQLCVRYLYSDLIHLENTVTWL